MGNLLPQKVYLHAFHTFFSGFRMTVEEPKQKAIANQSISTIIEAWKHNTFSLLKPTSQWKPGTLFWINQIKWSRSWCHARLRRLAKFPEWESHVDRTSVQQVCITTMNSSPGNHECFCPCYSFPYFASHCKRQNASTQCFIAWSLSSSSSLFLFSQLRWLAASTCSIPMDGLTPTVRQ